MVSMRHFIEQAVGISQVATFAVHIDKMIGDEKIRRAGGVVGKHVAVQRYALLKASVASTCVEESGIGLVVVLGLGVE